MEIKQFGKYAVDHLIGRGGMGTVYQAHSDDPQDINPETGEPLRVALKILSSSQELDSPSDQLSQRFEKEIAALRMLNHPNIVHILGFGVQDNQMYYAMELVEGPSLFELLRNGRRFSCDQTLAIAKQLTSAINAAHAHGVIHRDIKPGNILLAKDDETAPIVKLTDFGVARVFNSQPMTSIGNILGTIQYMAPEQAQGLPVGPQADLYSIGAVLYALLSGHPPFSGRTVPEILRQHASETIPPIVIDGRLLKPEFWSVLEQLLKNKTSERIPTALALLKRLDNIEWDADGDSSFSSATNILGNRNGADKSSASETTISLRTLDEKNLRLLKKGLQTKSEPSRNGAQTAALNNKNTYTDINREKKPTINWLAWASAAFWTIVFIAFVFWLVWFMRPLTAYEAYCRIQMNPALTSETRSTLIDRFLVEYPQDPHCKQVKLWKEELEVDKFERRMTARMTGKLLTDNDNLLERQYLRALKVSEISLEQGIEQFKAISDFYEMPEFAIKMPRDDFKKRICLRCVVRKLARLQEKIDLEGPEIEKRIKSRLEESKRLQEIGDYQTAERILNSIVILYSDQQFKNQVQAANKALQEIKEKRKR